jgi:non-specific serine/threonine protein kinase
MPIQRGQHHMIGESLGHYRILEKIGEGGMGVVYRARDEHLNREVAIKVLPADRVSDESALRRFRKEAEALSKLSHPNIATIFDFDREQGTAFLVMELVTGPTLAERLAGGALDEKEVARLGMQLAEALEAAHAQGVLHRDLKPSNLRLTADGRLKVLDFGLAKLLEAEPDAGRTLTTMTHGAAGTPPYMAPEQLRAEPADVRSDIYSAGAALYEAATGQLAFPEKVPTRLVSDILHRPPVAPRALNPRLSPELERILLKCLEKDAENRYQGAKELLVDLRRLGAPSAVAAAQPVASAGRTGKPRRELFAAAAGAVVLLVLLGYAGWRWREGHSTPAAAPLAAKPSVAVLPFQNLSGDPNNEYFSDGTTEEIITKLSKIKNLEVASRTSVARFKGTKEDVKQIGRELAVRYILEGSVRKAENRVRITAQLIDSSTGFHLWAEDFDRDLQDVFAVQEETALKIAGALNLQLSPQEQKDVRRRYTQDAVAYDAFLRGRFLQYDYSDPEKLELARNEFERALARDSNYVPAMAGLSWVEANYYRNVESAPAYLQRADQLAERARTMDAQLPAVHIAVGYVAAIRYNYRRAAEEFLEASRLDPEDAMAWNDRAWVLAYEQPPDAAGAEKAAREAIRLGMETIGPYYQLGRALLLQGRYDEAVAAMEHVRKLSPKSGQADLGLAQVYLAKGNYDQALSFWLRQTPALRQVAVAAFWGSSIYAARGDKDKALAELEISLEKGYRDFAAIDASPYFNSLRSDPRFQQLLRKYRQ